MDITIRAALPHQAAALGAIALQAKGHWGYSHEQLERWRPAFLTISADYIVANQVWVAAIDMELIGFAAIERHAEKAVLDHLWVLPAYIGQGVGKRLFLHVAAHIPRFAFTSDPHADAFYQKLGAQKIGETYSTLQQIRLTRFEYCLPQEL
jgi:GNAT superfamily N-acetyltransferase